MKCYEEIIKANNEDETFVKYWEADNSKAIVVLVHGIGEHCERYDHVAKRFNEHGFSFVSFDLRGHGKSNGKRGHIASYDVMMNEIEMVIKKAMEKYEDLPCFLYGHSMGGNLVLNFGLRKKLNLKGVLATSPWVKLVNEPSSFKRKMLYFLANITPSVLMDNGLDANDISHDKNVVNDYVSDKLNHSKVSIKLAAEADKAAIWALENGSKFPYPLLIVHGTSDKMTSHLGSKEFVEKVGQKANLKLWDGLFHETHNEPNNKDVIEYNIDWMEKILE